MGGLLAFAAVLEAVPRVGLVSPIYLPPLSAILVTLFADTNEHALPSDDDMEMEGSAVRVHTHTEPPPVPIDAGVDAAPGDAP